MICLLILINGLWFFILSDAPEDQKIRFFKRFLAMGGFFSFLVIITMASGPNAKYTTGPILLLMVAGGVLYGLMKVFQIFRKQIKVARRMNEIASRAKARRSITPTPGARIEPRL